MKIGIVSDTHDNLEKAREAADFFEEESCETVIHCGDMVAPFTAEVFDRDFDFHAVRGNNDGEWNLQSTVEEFGSFHGEQAELEFSGEKFAVYHGTSEPVARALVRSGEYDYVLRGHTHERKDETTRETREINPGGIRLPHQNESFSAAILDMDSGEVEFRVFES